MTISEIICLVVSVVCLISLIVVIVVSKRQKSNGGVDLSGVREQFYEINKIQMQAMKQNNDSFVQYITSAFNLQNNQLANLQKQLDRIMESNEQRLTRATDVLQQGLNKLQHDNEAKLEQMRQTVDEKLNASLEKRLNESFKIISERLEQVYRGLGEMQTLAQGVGDLKRVLTNVKTRGVYGEISLNSLLEQILSTSQFEKNVQIKPNSQERVDFAVVLPGKDESKIYLPIDAKFPIEDYQRLVDAVDRGDLVEVDAARKLLEKRVKTEAKSISEKYIVLPKTTDFAVMYLATEGLYAEIVKNPGLVEQLQRQYKIIVCGPTTITALLNSLQLGFKTLSIEKRSSEIWQLLGVFKQDFEHFATLLAKTQKKLEEATDTIEGASKRTQIIAKKLRNVSIDEGEETPLIENEEE